MPSSKRVEKEDSLAERVIAERDPSPYLTRYLISHIITSCDPLLYLRVADVGYVQDPEEPPQGTLDEETSPMVCCQDPGVV